MITPANTGNYVNKRMAVTKIDQTSGTSSREILLWYMLRIVEIKLITPIIEDMPAICKEKIVKSIEGPL
jgi:hypothetical protein